MIKAVLGNRIYLNRTKELHDDLISKLTYPVMSGKPNTPVEYICDVTRINKDILTIPIGRVDLIPKGYELVDKRILKPVKFPEFKFTLRESQKEVYNDCVDSCVICANPSWGKTFMGVALAAKLMQKTLVIVHTTYLRDQWVSEIKKCLGITAGIIGGGVFEVNDIITVANVQTLRNKMSTITREFGTIIVDEAHHVPADVFKTIVDAFNARYKIGLTATPWRKDGKHVLLGDYFNPKQYSPFDENRLMPNIIMIKSEIPFNANGMIPWGTRLNELYARDDYMELITNIAHIQALKGHLVLVVADRVEFLRVCADILEDEAMLVTGASTDRDFLNSGKKILFGSSKIYEEGINIPPLSSLVIAKPINNDGLLDQLIGRVCRKHEGKKNPEVIDIILKGKTGQNQAKQRLGYYMNKDYKVSYI
jgi:superfamily II DNA or RNA helicase